MISRMSTSSSARPTSALRGARVGSGSVSMRIGLRAAGGIGGGLASVFTTPIPLYGVAVTDGGRPDPGGRDGPSDTSATLSFTPGYVHLRVRSGYRQQRDEQGTGLLH